jgi:hypothetical protein
MLAKIFLPTLKEVSQMMSKLLAFCPVSKTPSYEDGSLPDRKHLSSMEFSDFMKDIRSKFLPKQWEDELLSKILRDHLRPGQDFLTWVTQLQQQNCILRNSTSQLDEKRLREQISIAVDMDLF